MGIDGDDMCVFSRSGNLPARSANDGKLVTFHTIPRFRSLVY
jgi:hypothetical protein